MSYAEQFTQDENIRNKVLREDGERCQDWPLTAAGQQIPCRNLCNSECGKKCEDRREERARRLADLQGIRGLEAQGIALPAGVTKANLKTKERRTSPTANVREITLPAGVLCPQPKREFIVQQTNCTTCDVMGLAKAIRKDRPWACPSKDRVPVKRGSKWCTENTKGIPGSIVVREGQNGKPGVINMMARNFPGKANRRETAAQRES